MESVEEYEEPVSPTGQYLNSSILSINNLGVYEVEVPIDDSAALPALESHFLPISPRFSSIIVRDEKGNQHWRRVKINLADHVIIPVFPDGEDCYDGYLQDYLSKIAAAELPPNRPLWDVHLIKYPTRAAAGTVVFRFQHALGDGFSLMVALFNCARRADDPSLPLTFPVAANRARLELSWWSKAGQALEMCVNTVWDFGWGLMKSMMVMDDRSPIRSGDAGVEFRPIVVSSIEFSLDDIKLVKTKLDGTVNDVITGTIFYAVQLYMQAVAGEVKKSPTALVLLNSRLVVNYQPIQEINKPDTQSPWGNHFGLLHVSLPGCVNVEAADPLSFILKAKKIIKTKRNSWGVYLTDTLLEMIRKIKGPEAAAQCIHQTLVSTSMTIINLIGPMQKMSMCEHPIKSMYFLVARCPQSLSFNVISYNGRLKVAMLTERGFIDAELLKSCMERSFQRIFEAAVGKRAY